MHRNRGQTRLTDIMAAENKATHCPEKGLTITVFTMSSVTTPSTMAKVNVPISLQNAEQAVRARWAWHGQQATE